MPYIHKYVISSTKTRSKCVMNEYSKILAKRDEHLRVYTNRMQIIFGKHYIYHFVSMYQLLRYGDALKVDEWMLDWTCCHFKETDLKRVIEILHRSFNYENYNKRIEKILDE